MKYLPGLLALLLLLPLAGQEAPPPATAPEPKIWILDADRDTNKSVFLQEGTSRAQLIELLGKRFSKVKNKKDTTVEILRFSRTIVGPVTEKLVSSGNGMMRLRQNILYLDRIEVTLKDGLVTNVTVKRELERNLGGVPRVTRFASPTLRPASGRAAR